ncbi:MAG TPA: hypothetical protein PKA42_02980 [Candidatus Paceibacterota bacterium]|nr:hypothetical protein [Candidatus Paceibacterota bacterium]HMO83109.1 hypothetical protein [Candidatus Paceibacterota bacterium]
MSIIRNTIDFEEEMKPIVMENMSAIVRSTFNIPRATSYSCFDEINGGFGVVDVFFYKLKKGYMNQRADTGIVGRKEAVETLMMFNNEGTTSFTYLRENLPYSGERLRSILRENMKVGAIRQVDNDSYEKVYEVGYESSLSIELKLRDWKKGLYQAYRYKWFSDASYLGLYSPYAEQAKRNIRMFETYNVGLMEIFDNGKIELIHKPTVEKPLSEKMRITTNESLVQRLWSVD